MVWCFQVCGDSIHGWLGVTLPRRGYPVQDDLTEVRRQDRRLSREGIVGWRLLHLLVLHLDFLLLPPLLLFLLHVVRHEVLQTDHVVLVAVLLVHRLRAVRLPLSIHEKLVVVCAVAGNHLNGVQIVPTAMEFDLRVT